MMCDISRVYLVVRHYFTIFAAEFATILINKDKNHYYEILERMQHEGMA